MKLIEVQLRDKVPTNSVGDTTSRLKSDEGPSANMGWALSFEQGVVTAAKGETTLLIPVGNVAYMRPEAKVVPVKVAKPAA